MPRELPVTRATLPSRRPEWVELIQRASDEGGSETEGGHGEHGKREQRGHEPRAGGGSAAEAGSVRCGLGRSAGIARRECASRWTGDEETDGQ